MFNLYLGILLNCVFEFSLAGFSYYYTQPFAQPQQYVHVEPTFNFAPPIASSFFQRTFLQPYTPLINTASIQPGVAASSQETNEVVQRVPDNFEVKATSRDPEENPANYNYGTIDISGELTPLIKQQEEYRGFAYRTQYSDGGFANVVFLTGSDFDYIQTLPPSLRAGKNLNNFTQTARTLASDSFDSNSLQDNKDAPPVNNPTITSLLQFLETPETAFQNFYSVNNKLFGRSNAFPNYPANTQPLKQPNTLLELFSRSNVANGSLQTTTEGKIESGSEETTEDADATESTTKIEAGEDFSASEVKLNSVIPEVTKDKDEQLTESTTEKELLIENDPATDNVVTTTEFTIHSAENSTKEEHITEKEKSIENDPATDNIVRTTEFINLTKEEHTTEETIKVSI